MRQQSLHRYFPTIRPRRSAAHRVQGPGLLDLPPSVRTLIYRHAGLVPLDGPQEDRVMLNAGSLTDGWCQYSNPTRVRDALRGLIQHPTGDDHPVPDLCCIHCGSVDLYCEEGRHCPGPCCFRCQLDEHDDETYYGEFPHQLFSVCRLLYEETTRLFYSETRFEIIRTAPGALMALRRLSPLAVSSLRDLTIRLNTCFCPERQGCTQTEHRVADCYSICRIGGHDEPLGERPGSRNDRSAWLDLRDVCGHLGRFLPPDQLKLAFVCEVKDYELATKLMETLRQLPPLRSCIISLSQADDPRLRELAQETQLRLVNPAHDSSKAFRLRDLPREIELQVLRNSGLVAPFHVVFDLRANQPTRRIRCIYEREISGFESVPIMCCCKYGAHSSSAWTCSHWHLPNSLFLVDRRMEEDARTIIYSDNYWVVSDLLGALAATKRSARMRAIFSRFLATVRRIQIQVPVRTPRPGRGCDAFLADLGRLFGTSISEKLDLTLSLSHPLHPAHVSHVFPPAWKEQDLMIQSVLAGLQGRRLRNFTVGFEREHIETDGEGYPRQIDCRMGRFLGTMEMQFEDRVATTQPRSYQEPPGAARNPKLHTGPETNEGHPCPVCGTIPGRWEYSYYSFPDLLFYHI
ncbi:hypothetical protein MFIFM68171_05670 [Madurella fahalii]|uniref:Uncharacterized protein n=1 Tax=Madurella fahalii TaxID=1157608 RepID=A0ABQ0GCQ3_9PEZI